MSKPVITIPPFGNRAKLPDCAAACGPLYDANGACVPPALASTLPSSVFTQCFCKDTRIASFATASTGICNDACTADPKGLSSIQRWYQSLCAIDPNNGNNGNNGGSTSMTSTSTTGGSSSGSSGSKSGGGGGGDWLSNHWQWVIFLVVMVVAIIGIWVGACIWRRRYLRKKDGTKYALGQNHSGSASRPSWGPGMETPGSVAAPVPYDPAPYEPKPNAPGQFMPGVAPAAAEKNAPNQRWVVNERT